MKETAIAGGVHRVVRSLPDEEATVALGRELSLFLRAGDWILLSGDLGAGKSTLARALIRALAPDAGEFEVPSPTFTLVQPYEFTRVPVVHADLYRIADPEEVHELGLEELAREHAVLVEWPDRLPLLPESFLHVHLADAADGKGRRAELAGHGEWAERLERLEAAHGFLRQALGGAEHERRFLQGDASARRYERIMRSDAPSLIFMDMPERADGPPVRDGRSYDEIARLARSARAVWAINTLLMERGFSAPAIEAADLEHGFLLLEDLGDAVFGRLYARKERMPPLLAAATDVLAVVRSMEWPREVATPAGPHVIPPYDDEAFLIEAELLLDWFWPHFAGGRPGAEAREDYRRLWRKLLPQAREERDVLVMRDYHSPNLIWLEAREGIARVGLIDTQDAVLGPAAYDLVSLLQDARVDVPPALEAEMLERYIAAVAASEPAFSADAFRLSYAIMGAQRAAKVLGIFVRLKQRDGKPGYMAHLPRVARYLLRNLEHPALAELREWLLAHLPVLGSPEALAEEGGNGHG